MKKIELKYLPQKDLFRVDEVAKFFDIHPKTPYKWIMKWKDIGEKGKYVDVPGVGIRIPRETIIIMIEQFSFSSHSTPE
jgi:hypothetical protein